MTPDEIRAAELERDRLLRINGRMTVGGGYRLDDSAEKIKVLNKAIAKLRGRLKQDHCGHCKCACADCT